MIGPVWDRVNSRTAGFSIHEGDLRITREARAICLLQLLQRQVPDSLMRKQKTNPMRTVSFEAAVEDWGTYDDSMQSKVIQGGDAGDLVEDGTPARRGR